MPRALLLTLVFHIAVWKEDVAVGVFLIGHCTHLSPTTAVAA